MAAGRPGRIRAAAQHDGGFGLIEVLVVVMLVGILTAIVVPSYNGLQASSHEAATRSDLASNRAAISAWSIDNTGSIPLALNFNPRAAGSDLTAYGWSQAADTTGYAYFTNTPVKPTRYCLQMTSSTGTVFRVSTNQDIAPGSCSALPVGSY